MKFHFSSDITLACGQYESSLNLQGFIAHGVEGSLQSSFMPGVIL
jgi:hypothetical protein